MKKELKVLAAVFAASVMFVFAGCKNETEEDTVTVEITSTVTTVIEDSTITLTAKVSPDDGTDLKVTWSSSDEDVAKINPDTGVVTGVSTGSVKITAKAGEKTDSVEIIVRSPVAGDIILADGSKVATDNYEDDKNNKPVAIVAGFNAKGAVLGLGLKKSDSTLTWAEEPDYKTKFTDIIGTTDSGDMDGSDNWDKICSVDSEGTEDAETNYPAFNFANTYGTYTDDLASGWYIPSIAELYKVYQNKTTLQTSLDKISGFTIGESSYWSSSQSSDYDNDAYVLDFFSGSVNSSSKICSDDVLVVRAF